MFILIILCLFHTYNALPTNFENTNNVLTIQQSDQSENSKLVIEQKIPCNLKIIQSSTQSTSNASTSSSTQSTTTLVTVSTQSSIQAANTILGSTDSTTLSTQSTTTLVTVSTQSSIEAANTILGSTDSTTLSTQSTTTLVTVSTQSSIEAANTILGSTDSTSILTTSTTLSTNSSISVTLSTSADVTLLSTQSTINAVKLLSIQSNDKTTVKQQTVTCNKKLNPSPTLCNKSSLSSSHPKTQFHSNTLSNLHKCTKHKLSKSHCDDNHLHGAKKANVNKIHENHLNKVFNQNEKLVETKKHDIYDRQEHLYDDRSG